MTAMGKKQFIDLMAKNHNMSKAEAERSLDAVTDSISKALSQGNEISFVGFGSFKVSHRKARTGRNPKTGQPITIKAAKRAVFRAGAKLKALFNK
jgi:DNA-binding protein HU-beta